MSKTATTSRPDAGSRLGERVRALRVAAGLTQSDLSAGRFSKEYISQIERGKTRPTDDTVAWLAQRLGVEPELLAAGVSVEQRTKAEAVLTRAEALSEAHRYSEAVETFRQARPLVEGTEVTPLEVRALAGEAWALVQHGDIREAIGLLERARQLAEDPEFSDVDRADVLFRLAVCRYKLASYSTALAMFDEALRLAEASGLPCDLLRADVLGWRSRTHRRQRDYVAAREDVERALELAQDLGDRRTLANTYFQASLIGEKMGHWVQSRNYAQRARTLYEELEDERTVGRLLTTLGGLTFLLGKPEQAITHLSEAVAHAVEVDSPPDAAQALSGLALVQLHLGAHDESERHARKALELLEGTEDFLDEFGQVQLTLGRTLLERDRLEEAEECFRAADALFEQLALVNHRARAWVALGDLASRRGDEAGAARLYRNAAEALQDVRF